MIVVAALALAGCVGAPSAESSPSLSGPTTSPSPSVGAGQEVAGTGYAYTVPEGWGLSPQDIPGFDPDTFAIDLQDKGRFTDNVNVILSPAGRLTAEQAEDAAQAELADGGFRGISISGRVDVAGSEAAHVTASGSTNDLEYTIEQFYPTKGDQTYIVTFSFSSNVVPADRLLVTSGVLDSWEWTD